MTAAIHPEFKRHFDELETMYLDLHQRLNTLPEKDGNLEGYLALDHDIKTIHAVSCHCTDETLCYAVTNAFAIIKGHDRIAVPRRAVMKLCNPLRDFQGVNRAFVPLKYRIARPDTYANQFMILSVLK